MVSEGFVTFCVHFKYLGSWILFSLCDDYDVGRRIGTSNASMGALEILWRDHHVDVYSKYIIFWEIPCNLLLWGCESWALCQSLLNKLDVFLHRIIRRILGIIMGQVIERHIKNSHIFTMFYNIPCMRNQAAFRQMTYVGKILCCESYHVPTRFLTAWCNSPSKWGGQLLTKKDRLVRKLRIIIPGVDGAFSVSTWGFHALNETHWFLLLATLKHPSNTTPDHPPQTNRKPIETYPNPPPPLPSPLNRLLPHNHHTHYQGLVGPQADRKGLAGCGPLTILLLFRLHRQDLPREIHLPLPLLAVEKIITRGE